MNVIKADLAQPLMLGKQGEHGVTQVVFDLSGYIKKYGDGVAQLTVKRSSDPLEYAAVLAQTGDTATWEIGAEWTQNAGQGYCYLHWFVDDDHAKSDRFKTLVRESNSTCDAPEPQTGYLDQVVSAGTQAVKASEQAKRYAEATAVTAKRFDEEYVAKIEGLVAEAEAAANRAAEYDPKPPYINKETNTWMEWDGTQYVDTGKLASVEVDDTLSVEGKAADAKATGEALDKKLDLTGGTMTGPLHSDEYLRVKTPLNGKDYYLRIGGDPSDPPDESKIYTEGYDPCDGDAVFYRSPSGARIKSPDSVDYKDGWPYPVLGSELEIGSSGVSFTPSRRVGIEKPSAQTLASQTWVEERIKESTDEQNAINTEFQNKLNQVYDTANYATETINRTADYVVEWGTKEDGAFITYRKWNSGIAEIWFRKIWSGKLSKLSNVPALAAALGVSIYGADIGKTVLPFTFTDIPRITTNLSTNVSGTVLSAASGDLCTFDVAPGFRIIALDAFDASAQFFVDYYLVGRYRDTPMYGD